MTPQRISILGPPGSGKSTLARQLGDLLSLPVTHLDQLYWLPGWTPRAQDEFVEVAGRVACGPGWIIEGNYSETYPGRLDRSDLIIWLDLPRRIYLARALLRILKNYGRIRPDAAPGCPEQIDWVFLRYVWDYPRQSRPKIENAIIRHREGRGVERLIRPADVSGLVRRLATTA